MSARASFLLAALAGAAAAALPAARADAQPASLAARVAAAPGRVTLRYAARPSACGDGREFLALGDHFSLQGSSRSVGRGRWRDAGCVPGPVRVTLALRGGAPDEVRVRVGGSEGTASDGARDLGAVPAAEAAAYLMSLAERGTGRAAEQAVLGAVLADSADVWQPLLALARRHPDDEVARSTMHWLGAVAPRAATPALAAALADGGERRAVREGAATALAHAPDGAGVPALVAAASGRREAGGGDAWARERAVFWLGTARHPDGRQALRTLAAADTAPEAVRDRAIFALGHLDGDDGAWTNGEFLRALYPRLAADRLQDRVIMSVAQMADADSRRWLLGLAADGAQPLAARKRALFWAAQGGRTPIAELVAVDARLTGTELRRHYAFVLSQRPEEAAVERLIAMARTDAEPAVRRQATFWLGQSRHPRARQYLESVVMR